MFLCHILDYKIGNLQEQTWDDLWTSHNAEEGRRFATQCERCWLICTSKSQIWQHKWSIGSEMVRGKVASLLGRRAGASAEPDGATRQV